MRTSTWILVIGVFVSAISPARADQVSDEAQKPTTRQYDTRLPAVLPGEEVVTETGQRMRVWSSAGPVPVNPRPTPQTLYGNGNNGAPSIIVDGRRGDGRRDAVKPPDF